MSEQAQGDSIFMRPLGNAEDLHHRLAEMSVENLLDQGDLYVAMSRAALDRSNVVEAFSAFQKADRFCCEAEDHTRYKLNRSTSKLLEHIWELKFQLGLLRARLGDESLDTEPASS